MAILAGLRCASAAVRGCAALSILCGCLPGQTAAPDLSQASLEDLMNIRVASVSRKEQKLSKTGAAIFVITGEDSGVRARQHPRPASLGARRGCSTGGCESLGHQHPGVQRSARQQGAGVD